jgi:GT2 family glycosyltransferase
MMVAASLIIPTYNRSEVLLDTLGMAVRQEYGSYEIIVVDQTKSIDARLRRYLSAAGDRIQYIHLPEPSLPAARNAGIRAAKGDIILFVDDDVRIEPDYLAGHMRNYEDPAVGGVMGALVKSFDQPGDVYLDSFKSSSRGHWPEFTVAPGPRPDVSLVNWLIGCNASYRRRALVDVGLCDERFSGSGWCEDADLSMRIGRAGYTLLLDSRIKLIHLELSSGGCRNRDATALEAIGMQQVQLYLYCILKNRSTVGYEEVWRGLAHTYRKCALNRTIASRGPREMARQHAAYARMLANAYRWRLAAKPVPSQPTHVGPPNNR